MPHNDGLVQTPSGAMVPVSDIVAIRKEARNNTVRNVLAGIGLVTVGAFAYGMLKANREKKQSQNDD